MWPYRQLDHFAMKASQSESWILRSIRPIPTARDAVWMDLDTYLVLFALDWGMSELIATLRVGVVKLTRWHVRSLHRPLWWNVFKTLAATRTERKNTINGLQLLQRPRLNSRNWFDSGNRSTCSGLTKPAILSGSANRYQLQMWLRTPPWNSTISWDNNVRVENGVTSTTTDGGHLFVWFLQCYL